MNQLSTGPCHRRQYCAPHRQAALISAPSANGGNSFSGSGSTTLTLDFGLGNGSGSPLPGGTASLEIWCAFSGIAITTVPTPLPASLPLLFGAAGVLGKYGRRASIAA